MDAPTQNAVDAPLVLEAIIGEDAYRDDYKKITAPLLFEDVTYEEQ